MKLHRERNHRLIVSLRALLGVGLGCLLLAGKEPDGFGFAEWLLIVFFAVTPALAMLGRRFAHLLAFDLWMVLLDTVAAAVLVFHVAGSRLTVLFFIALLIIALEERLSAQLISVSALAAFDAWWTWDTTRVLEASLLVRVPMLYAATLYYGTYVRTVRAERSAAVRARIESDELRSIVRILEDVTSSLDPAEVMRKVVERVNLYLPSQRVSILMLDDDPRYATVLASSDDPGVRNLQIELDKYPEVREAIRSGAPLVIDDVHASELLAPVRDKIRALGFGALLLQPLVVGDQTLGTLILRAWRRGREFDPGEVQFCASVGAACANALRNAFLHDRMISTAETRRALAEQFDVLLKHSPHLVLVADRAGRILRCSDSALHVLGAEHRDLEGRHLGEVFPGICEIEAHRSLVAKGALQQPRAALVRTDGGRVDADVLLVRADRAEDSLILIARSQPDRGRGRQDPDGRRDGSSGAAPR